MSAIAGDDGLGFPKRDHAGGVAQPQLDGGQLLDIFTRARSAKASQLWRVTGVPLLLGLLLGAAGLILFASSKELSSEWFVAHSLIFTCFPLLLLATPPTHALAVNFLSVAIAAILLAYGLSNLVLALEVHNNAARLSSCGVVPFLNSVVHSYALASLAQASGALVILHSLALRLAQRRTSREQLGVFWNVLACLYFLKALPLLPFLLFYLVLVETRYEGTAWFLLSLLIHLLALACGIFCSNVRLRLRLHAWLAARGEGVNAAAGIAVLLGRADPSTAVSDGERRLRAVSCGLLTPEVFSEATDGDKQWPALSQPAELDEVDCFVSHSWHDDPAAKYAALQAWRAEFVAAHRREPLIWLDSCCLTEVGDDLPHLPIFIAACRQLLILAGPTYATRLWCLVECFVFDQMAPHLGSADEATRAALVQLRPLPGCDVAAFGAIDVSECECALQADYDGLLAVIETAYGSTGAFDARARALLLAMPRVEWAEPPAGARGPAGDRVAPAKPRAPASGAAPGAAATRWGAPSARTAADKARGARRARRMPVLLATLAFCVYVVCAVPYSTWATAPARDECDRCEGVLDGLRVPGETAWYYASEAGARARAGRAFGYSAADASGSSALSWAGALAACEAAGGSLARPHDAAEERNLQCVLGMRSRGTWIAVPPAGAYANWAERNALEAGVMCPELYPWGMRASDCGLAIHYVCERLQS